MITENRSFAVVYSRLKSYCSIVKLRLSRLHWMTLSIYLKLLFLKSLEHLVELYDMQ